MKLWVGITDDDWFRFLAEIKPDEVNFWQPSGGRIFQVLQPGELFLFKLHSPNNYIVGGGHFVSSTPLPASLAWEAFGLKNGVRSLDELVARVRKYSKKNNAPDPVIGCNVLAEPFFLSRSQWIPVPEDWSKNIVTGKSYDSASVQGAALLGQLAASLAGVRDEDRASYVSNIEAARYGSEYLTRGRLGQGAFRVLVTDAYTRRCAVTGEKTLRPSSRRALPNHSTPCGELEIWKTGNLGTRRRRASRRYRAVDIPARRSSMCSKAYGSIRSKARER